MFSPHATKASRETLGLGRALRRGYGWLGRRDSMAARRSSMRLRAALYSCSRASVRASRVSSSDEMNSDVTVAVRNEMNVIPSSITNPPDDVRPHAVFGTMSP